MLIQRIKISNFKTYHTNCQTGNNSGCRTGFGLLSDFLNTPEISRGIDLGDLADDHTNQKTGCDSPEST